MTKYAVNRFRNVTIALNTPFDAKGEISLAATRNFVQYQYTKGVRSLYVCGSTGEGFLLSIPERKQILEAVVSAAPEDMTIIVHVGTAATREAVDLAAHTAKTETHATSGRNPKRPNTMSMIFAAADPGGSRSLLPGRQIGRASCRERV